MKLAMKRICLLLLLVGACTFSLHAAHIRGGELYYQYLGPGTAPNSSSYLLTLKLYIDCGQNQEGQLDERAALTIFSKSTNAQYGGVRMAGMVRDREEFIRYDPNSNPCINNPPTDVCYRLRYYEAIIELPDTPDGYTIAFQRCCRIQGIQNLNPPSNDVGATYLCEIPGTRSLPDAVQNSSPSITANDAVAVCMGSTFEFDFSATDNEGDSLVYNFCNAYAGGGPGRGENCLNCPVPIPGAPPPYHSLSYRSPYTGGTPLGNTVTIDPNTGVIRGVAPANIGQYVVTVCVQEYRRGVLINTHRKDIHIKVSDCIPLRARLNPDYSFCDDFLVSFRNLQVNPPGSVYTWDFGDGSAPAISQVPDGTIQHQYADTGTYTVKLKVVLAGQCLDSTTAIAKVYPGFFPGFIYNGACLYTPFIFTDTTKSRYGNPAFWRWQFGDETTEADTSRISTPSWQYSSLGNKNVQLIVASDKGCIDTVNTIVEVTEKPDLFLPFTDTLICSVDSLQLQAIGDGVFEWTPGYNIFDGQTGTPTVFPKTTTTYTVTMTEDRCTTTEDVRVRVVDFVTLDAGTDTTICATDTLQLWPGGDGLQFNWTATPDAYFSDRQARNPFTTPASATSVYRVEASIGSCSAEDALTVHTVPYPIAQVWQDTTICYDDTVHIIGYTNGSSFRWTPSASLLNAETLNPSAFPLRTTTYTLWGYDTLGCPKPGIAEVTIAVKPEIFASAGNDTAVVRGQPLQLSGAGAAFYSWSPERGLTQPSAANPLVYPDHSMTYILRAYDADGCFDLDSVRVQVFQTMPDIFVPNAFVPLGSNNELRPRPVGISQLLYFNVYNRWGQLVFRTTAIGRGWDGRVNGSLQNSGTYVWMAAGVDYTGKKVIKKGTAVLIR